MRFTQRIIKLFTINPKEYDENINSNENFDSIDSNKYSKLFRILFSKPQLILIILFVCFIKLAGTPLVDCIGILIAFYLIIFLPLNIIYRLLQYLYSKIFQSKDTPISKNHIPAKDTINDTLPFSDDTDSTNIDSVSLSPVEHTVLEDDTINNEISSPSYDENTHSNNIKQDEDIYEPYQSNKVIIKGLNEYFICVARDIINQGSVNELALQRTYNIESSELSNILQEIKDAKILDDNNDILMTPEKLEHFFDIYQPDIFKCKHSTFDKNIFICLGEIIIEQGIKAAQDCFQTTDELLDYLNIMEKLQIIKFDNPNYSVCCTKAEFINICSGVPEYYASFAPAKNPNTYNLLRVDYSLLNGYEFEQFCASLLISSNYVNVVVTQRSSDHGIDILAEKDGISYAIQCKRYSDNVGNSAVQQAYTGKKLYNKDIAIVMTNSHFTQQAINEATSLGVKLWDNDVIQALLNTNITENQ